MENTHVCAYMFRIYMKAQKRTCFRVFSPFSAHLYPHYIIMVKGTVAGPIKRRYKE